MPLKNSLKSYRLTNATSAAASITTAPTGIQYLDNVTFQANFTGSPVGVLTVEVSLDYNQDAEGNVTNAGHWVTVQSTPGTDASLAVSGANSYVFNCTQLGAPWARLKYTRTSGTGTMTSYISAKAV